MAYLAFFIGALASTFLISRLAIWLLNKVLEQPLSLLLGNGATLVFAVSMYAVLGANGGSPDFVDALVRYIPPVAVCLVFDFWRHRRTNADGI